MKGKIDFKIFIIIILTSILITMCYFYFKDESNNTYDDTQLNIRNSDANAQNQENINNKDSNATIISATGEISSELTETMQLHATYYLEKSYIQINQLVKSGENILKYTNGTYLTAPYDLIITEINIPKEQEKCTNEHYIKISSNNNLKVQLKVDETKINNIHLGQKASVEILAYENKILEGIVTNISSTASDGKFTVTVEFENDKEVMIGMTSVVTIKND